MLPFQYYNCEWESETGVVFYGCILDEVIGDFNINEEFDQIAIDLSTLTIYFYRLKKEDLVLIDSLNIYIGDNDV